MKLFRLSYRDLRSCLGFGFLCFSQIMAAEEPPKIGVIPLLKSIQTFESDNDPKCHATASRLEDFMYGTPLTPEARFQKNELTKALVLDCWKLGHRLAKQEEREEISVRLMKQAQAFFPHISLQKDEGIWKVHAGKTQVSITERDLKHYGSVAYTLRAILSVQQERGAEPLTPLASQALNRLKVQADLYQLAVIQLSDQEARSAQQKEISAEDILRNWKRLKLPLPVKGSEETSKKTAPLLPSLIKQKLAAYEKYNAISNQLFIRNLQVYFAKRRWPAKPEEGKVLKEGYGTAVINYAMDLYMGAQKLAEKRGDHFVRESDVHQVMQKFTPFEVNQFEDVIFFPNLGEDRVMLEAYDLDAYRDGGLHWSYLKHALNESGGAIQMDADPFAAELLAEGIAQFGVLTWRIAGEVAISREEERLSLAHIEAAIMAIQLRVNRTLKGERVVEEKEGLASSPSLEKNTEKDLFQEVTQKVGIESEHRSSDWLSRQLRTYLKASEERGVITIPPAFGGSGIAAEDIDNDGDADLLILSGLGNQLYRNDGGTFTEITKSAGLSWVRPDDGKPGEPRQPIIADFDNDGWQDLLITYVNDEHRLYRNQGDGTFMDMTSQAALGGKGLVAGPATVFDFDKDGKLDLYIGYFGNYLKGTLPTLDRRNRNGSPNQLFRNVGGMRFENVTEQSGTGDVGWGQAVGHTDLNGDGWQDLVVGNDFGVNAYYLNQGDGTFKEISAQLGTDKPSYTMGIGIADLNRDQLPDIYISNIVTMNKDQKYVLPNKDTEMAFNPEKLANMRVVEANDLFLSKAGGGFELSSLVDRGYSSTGWSWDADFFDYDHDGDEDLYVLNGMNDFNVYSTENPYYRNPHDGEKVNVVFSQSHREKNVLFQNEGGRLRQQESGLELLSNARSAAYFDYDLDGDLDVVLNNYHGPAALMQNQAGVKSGRWLKVRLVGNPEKGVTRDAIGARLLLNGKSIKQVWREVHGTIGYLSVHPKEQHFGVGDEDTVDLTITWPNGEIQNLNGLATNQAHQISQP